MLADERSPLLHLPVFNPRIPSSDGADVATGPRYAMPERCLWGTVPLCFLPPIVFGAYRLLLATFVLLGHLPHVTVRAAGNYSVFAFYLLSGYLMTLVLNETYGFSPRSIGRFLLNRALRIYPPYFAALVLAVACLWLRWWMHGTRIGPLDDPGIADWMSQILLVDVPGARVARWIVPSWSLNVEVGYYVALVFLARRRSIVVIWTLLSLAVLARMLWTGGSFIERYFTYAAASLPFSLGSLLHHLRDVLPRASLGWGLVACGAYSINATAGQYLWRDPTMEGFYLSLALALIVVVLLRDPRVLAVGPRIRRLDARCGDLAYPLFLVHQPITVAVAALLPLRLPGRQAWLAVGAIALSFLGAWLLHRLVEAPIARWRDRVRPAAPVGPATALDAASRPPRDGQLLDRRASS